MYRQEKRHSEAKELLERAVKINPEFPAAWMNLGIVQASLGHFRDSEGSYRNALRLRPRYADCHFNLGNLHLKAGDVAAAIEEFEIAIGQVRKGCLTRGQWPYGRAGNKGNEK